MYLLSLSAFTCVVSLAIIGSELSLYPPLIGDEITWIAVLLSLVIAALHYRLLIYDGRLEGISNEFKNVSPLKSRGSGWYVFTYVVGLPACFLITLLILVSLKQ